ncbi:MAG: multidrug DMT transporter permease [Chitinophagaceae bacterium]
MLCWGSWTNTQKLAAVTGRFELFYWDYVIGILLLTVIFAFTLGSNGSAGRGFVADISQASNDNLFSAMLGGIIFNAANILLVAAISIAGMRVAFPVGIGIALVLGVVVNYINAPQGNAAMLFGGVALIGVAILLNAGAYKKMSSGSISPSTKGADAFCCGGLIGFFYRFVAKAMFSDFTLPETGKIGPYTAMVVFAVGILLSNFIFNTYIMKEPFVGEPVIFSQYFKGGFRNHLTAILGGII